MLKWIKILFPFLITIALWRHSHNIFNPSGILAIIPVFYYAFIRKTKYFIPFAIIVCMLVDWNFDTVLFWTLLFCIAYAINSFQSVILLQNQSGRGLFFFMGYIGVVLGALGVWGALNAYSFAPIAIAVWMFLWCAILYLPITAISERIDA